MWTTTVALTLLLGQVAAGLLGEVTHVLHRDDHIERVARRMVKELSGGVERRQLVSTTPPLNVAAWDAEVQAACSTQLSKLNGTASNPAGLASCYNVPSVNKSTGVFYADLRIYMITAATGTFAGVPPENVMVGLDFSGATAQTINESSLMKRGDTYSMTSWPVIRNEKKARQVMGPILVQSYALVGQINMSMLTDNTDATYEPLLTPTVTLSATASNATMINATLSTTEASFLVGDFTTPALANAAAAVTANMTGIGAVVNPPGTLFLMPGTKILIFPVGAIVTGVWAVALVATVTYGTVGRIAFREQFRRRSARAGGADLKRI